MPWISLRTALSQRQDAASFDECLAAERRSRCGGKPAAMRSAIARFLHRQAKEMGCWRFDAARRILRGQALVAQGEHSSLQEILLGLSSPRGSSLAKEIKWPKGKQGIARQIREGIQLHIVTLQAMEKAKRVLKRDARGAGAESPAGVPEMAH